LSFRKQKERRNEEAYAVGNMNRGESEATGLLPGEEVERTEEVGWEKGKKS